MSEESILNISDAMDDGNSGQAQSDNQSEDGNENGPGNTETSIEQQKTAVDFSSLPPQVMEKLPEKYHKTNDPLGEFVKGYKELERKLHTDAPSEYQINIDQSLAEKGISIDAEDPLYQSALEFAKEAKMPQEQFDKLVNLYLSDAASAIADKEAELAKLGNEQEQKEFIDQTVSLVATRARHAGLNEAEVKAIESTFVTADSIKAINKLLSARGATASLPDSGSSTNSDADIVNKYLNIVNTDEFKSNGTYQAQIQAEMNSPEVRAAFARHRNNKRK